MKDLAAYTVILAMGFASGSTLDSLYIYAQQHHSSGIISSSEPIDVPVVTQTASFMTCVGEKSCRVKYSCEVDVTDWEAIDKGKFTEKEIRNYIGQISDADRVCGRSFLRHKIIEHFVAKLERFV